MFEWYRQRYHYVNMRVHCKLGKAFLVGLTKLVQVCNLFI